MRLIKEKISKEIEIVFTVCLVFYIWYLGSTLILPLADLIPLPNFVFVTLYSLSAFPPLILVFILCVSLMSVIMILGEFREAKTSTKIFLIEGISFFLYFIIPLIATIFFLFLISVNPSAEFPDELRVSLIIEDLFIFSSILFIMTAILNLATYKVLDSFGCCSEYEYSKDKFK